MTERRSSLLLARTRTTDRNPTVGRGISSFGQILRSAVLATPGAIGGAFADWEGEMIDSYSSRDPHEWALITAHYGIVLSQLDAAFGTWHFGGPEYFIAQHAALDIVVHAVGDQYYALMAVTAPAALALALISLRDAARALQRELG
jgi:hypothetical protein